MPPDNPPKALIFDLMGTCTDWHTSILTALQSTPTLYPQPNIEHNPTQISSTSFHSQLAKDWRSGFFTEIHRRFEAGESAEDIDVTHRRVLDRLLGEKGVGNGNESVSRGEGWNDEVRGELVRAWHQQVGMLFYDLRDIRA